MVAAQRGIGPKKQALVFVDYTNPTVDCKSAVNKQKVAKHAMLGRTRSSEEQKVTRSSTVSVSMAANSAPEPLELLPPAATSGPYDEYAIVPNHHQLDDASAMLHTSLPDAVSSLHDPMLNSDAIQYSALTDLSLSKSWPLVDLTIRPTSYFELGLGPASDDFSVVSVDEEYPGDASPSITLTASRTRASQRRRFKTRPATSSLPAFQQLDPNEAASLAWDRSRLVQRGNSLIRVLSAAPRDPFNALPIRASPRTDELLYQYMNARLISSVYASGSSDTLERIKKMRKSVWGPLVSQSKTCLSALVAYVESTPGIPKKAGNEDFLYHHVQAAMQGIREGLALGQEIARDDGICFAVMLLMLTAQRTGNMQTYVAHGSGLAALLEYRTAAIDARGEQQDTVRRLHSFYSSNRSEEPCLYCLGSQEGKDLIEVPKPATFFDSADSFSLSAEQRGQGFRQLVNRGILSQALNGFLDPAMYWSTLADRARRDKLSAAIGATHAWIDEGEFTLKGRFHPLNTACHSSARLCFYLSSWLSWQHACSAVRRIANAVYMSLQYTDIGQLLGECPNLLLWMSLIVGPLSSGRERLFFFDLMQRARANMGLTIWDFDDQISGFGREFVWSTSMTPGADSFWHETSASDVEDCAVPIQETWIM